jgi:hypothetical protein
MSIPALDDGALMVIVNEQIDWLLGKADTSRDAGKLALLSVLMHVRDVASGDADTQQPVASAPAVPVSALRALLERWMDHDGNLIDDGVTELLKLCDQAEKP